MNATNEIGNDTHSYESWIMVQAWINKIPEKLRLSLQEKTKTTFLCLQHIRHPAGM